MWRGDRSERMDGDTIAAVTRRHQRSDWLPRSHRWAYLWAQMTSIDVVLDTNVVIAGMRSNRGASFRVLSLIGDERFRVAISVPLVVEYEAVALRTGTGIPLDPEDILAILDRICALGRRVEIYFQWRPHLPDPEDEFILELAVGGGCRYRNAQRAGFRGRRAVRHRGDPSA